MPTVTVEETVGDCAYGDSDTRQTFAEAGRTLVAKVANRRGQAQFPKDDFRIDLETMSCVCPAGQQTRKVVSISSGEALRCPRRPAARVPLRRHHLRRLSVAAFMHASTPRQRPSGDDPSTGGLAPGGEGLPAVARRSRRIANYGRPPSTGWRG